MRFHMGIFLMLGAIVVGAEEQNTRSPSEIRLDNKTRQLAASLRNSDITPEERAIRIEQWQREQEPLVRKIRTERAARLPASAIPAASRPTENVVTPDEPASSDPLLTDIQATESEIRAIHRSIETALITPEERAIQIEQFQLLNKESFRQLDDLRKEAAAQTRVAAAPMAAEPADAAPVSGQSAQLKAELDRIQHDLSQVDPETRAQYLETHAATLREMGDASLQFMDAPRKDP